MTRKYVFMKNKSWKYYLKFTLICFLIMSTIFLVIPIIIFNAYRFANRINEQKLQFEAEKQISVSESAGNQGVLPDKAPEGLTLEGGVILESAPDELTSRTEDTFDGSFDSLYKYYGASEPIKVSSNSDEFEDFCRKFFFDYPKPVIFYRSANETTYAVCGEYEIYRTEYFNPTVGDSGQLYYKVDGFEDGMSLITDFIYDPTGKYAMIWYDCGDSAKYVQAKFIGLKFDEKNPYVSPIQDELDKLSLREFGSFKGDIWKYAASKSVVRVESDEDEFVQYCDELFKDCDEKIVYWPAKDSSVAVAECGDYIMLRTQFFDPVSYGEGLIYEGDSMGDTEPVRSKFFYDCTGKYALVYWGNNSQNDIQNELCLKFLGFHIENEQ